MTLQTIKQSDTSEALLGKSLSELTTWVQDRGQPAYRGKQLHQWLYQKGARSLGDISVLPKPWREEMADYPLGRSTIHYRSVAPDQTRKYLLRLADGLIIEAVGIPTAKRLTVCVSSQVGCPMDCDFCATGKGGFTRNLKAHEIVDQVLTVQSDFEQRVSNVVFMGMGEPMANLDEVVLAVKSLNQDVGIGARSLTVSTVGIPGKIQQLAQHRLQIVLAVSLHASNQALREQLIPSAKKYTLDHLLDECRDYIQVTGRRVTFEYVLLAGVNDLPENAQELTQRLKGFQTHVNLIPYNPISEVDYQRPRNHRIREFSTILEQANIAVSVRYSRGLEADAACGQLRASKV
ncbi:MAG: 23S rRNA (adenine(2503)-C(2))-methyltransferase RlmN [Pleurocapsa minor HA4230-MV1]|jgi:23S rRNA (adenine2503-C2)-methyltransferase|nr:23S rRNA (adenine(2503)-C(2))-methyltransferase RlmN [Pleurocapsa minor HA4230-MV1]